LAEDDERLSLIRFMEERFGIPASDFCDCVFFKHRQSWWVVKNSSHLSLPHKVKVKMVGLKAFQKVGAFIKPTTRLIQAVGPKATKSRVDLTEDELKNLLRRGDIDFVSSDLEDGYVILCLDCYVLGLGLLIRGKLKSQLPRKDLIYYGLNR
jgi:NOL1/NOP2/fmu family ribosome biogenesis protein